MPTPIDPKAESLAKDVIQAFDNLNGPHQGFRPAHAKGILLSGTFQPSAGASSLSIAPHLQRHSTPVSARFSDFTGIPSIPDNSPDAAPRGLAIRFHLAEHTHTDIIAHSTDGFPVRTVEEFLGFLQSLKAGTIQEFLGAHPAALAFVQIPKPFPASFAREAFFGVSAHRFTNESQVSRYGRYRIRPADGTEYLTVEAAAAKSPDYLFEDIKDRLEKGAVKLQVAVQVAEAGDVVDDSTVHWPPYRAEVDFCKIELTAVVPDNDAAQRHIIFDPIARVAGIDPSADPLLEPRATIYLMTGRRRRTG